jgi:hypothetical protein
MITLRALIGAGFLLAIIGLVVFVPLGWSLLLGIVEEAYPEKINQGRPHQSNAELVHKGKILPLTTHEQIRDKIEVKQK